MENTRKEYGRILKNPSNLIVSEGLEDIIDGLSEKEVHLEEEEKSQDFLDPLRKLQGTVHINFKDHICEILKIQKNPGGFFKIKCYAPSFPVVDFVKEKRISFSFEDQRFSVGDECSVTFHNSGILTFTARRIINNEEV